MRLTRVNKKFNRFNSFSKDKQKCCDDILELNQFFITKLIANES